MYLSLETCREGYSPDQCRRTITVREMIEFLEQYEDDTKIYFSNDNGYTYGSISTNKFEEKYDDEESENDED